MSSSQPAYGASGDPDTGAESAADNEPPKSRVRAKKRAESGQAKRRGRPPKHSKSIIWPTLRMNDLIVFDPAPYPVVSHTLSAASDPMLSPIRSQSQRHRPSPVRAPISEAVTQWNAARRRQMTMLTARLKKENGGQQADEGELMRQIEAWEATTPKPEHPGDRVFLTETSEPATNESVLEPGSELREPGASVANAPQNTLQESESRPHREEESSDTEMDPELSDWLLANSPAPPSAQWYKDDNLYTSLITANDDPMAKYPTSGLLPQQSQNTFQGTQQSLPILFGQEYMDPTFGSHSDMVSGETSTGSSFAQQAREGPISDCDT